MYDKLGIAGAIGKRVTVKASLSSSPGVRILRPLDPKDSVISRKDLESKLSRFKELYSLKKFDEIKTFSFIDALHVVLAETLSRTGYADLLVEISFDEPLKNIGRSASKSAGIAFAVSRLLGKNFSLKETAEIAYLGDVVAHGGTPSGIDTNTVVFGGYVKFRKSEGIQPLALDARLPLVLVDSGEPAKTSVTVPAVRRLREERAEFVDNVLSEIDSVSVNALRELKAKNLDALGSLMNQNHALLQKLSVSTPKLDSLCETSLKAGALGAKMTGGGGGGSIIALARDEGEAARLQGVFHSNGFKAFIAELGVEGARIED